MNENANISPEGQQLLKEIKDADHLYCSSYGDGIDYFGACDIGSDGKQHYRVIITERNVVDELCSHGFLERKESIPSLAGAIDQIWEVTTTTKKWFSEKKAQSNIVFEHEREPTAG